MRKSGLMAPPSNTDFARISQALISVQKDLNPILKELGIILVPMWRCSHRNNRWRCSNMTHAPNTKCRKCRETKKKRERGYWAFKIISNSIKKDRQQMRQRRFIRCSKCRIPMLRRIQPKRGRPVLQMCDQCRYLRWREQIAASQALNKVANTYKKVVGESKKTDRRKGYDYRNDPKYVSVQWVKDQRQRQKNKCYYCDSVLETDCNRLTHPRGLQIERLTDGPHWAADCVLSCSSCNRRSWRKGWGPYPHNVARILGQKFQQDRDHPGYLAGTVEGRKYERNDFGNYVENGVTQCMPPSQMPSRRAIAQQARIVEQLRQLRVQS